jgi:hypothetical protein
MSRRTPTESFRIIVIGGLIFGVILVGLGAYYLDNVFHQGGNPATYLPLALTFFSIGASFVLVAAVILPALRAMRLEIRDPAEKP